MKKILTIAASDSGGGAGIQADIKTITILNGYAMSAVTALTAQNTLGVQAVHPVPTECVQQQIEAVCSDIGADAVKTGMLLNAETISTVSRQLRQQNIPLVVIDPVMRSTSGDTLLEENAVEALRQELLPLATMVTPNLDEASTLAGMTVDSIETMQEAARSIHGMGPQYVLIKGGHLSRECTDVLFDGEGFTEFTAPRVDSDNTHGTGCTLSAAIATLLAQGLQATQAVQAAKDFLTDAVRNGLPLGKGHGPTNPFARVARDAHLQRCTTSLMEAFNKLEAAKIGNLIPEIQSNFGYALPGAETATDVVAFPGRIIRFGNTIKHLAAPAPGSSQHIAKIILTSMRYFSTYRAAMNICWTPQLIDTCRAIGLTVDSFDRRLEPADVKEREGSTLEWGTQQVLSKSSTPPDVIYDEGDVGKEPVSRVLGTDPIDVADKIIKIAKEISQTC